MDYILVHFSKNKGVNNMAIANEVKFRGKIIRNRFNSDDFKIYVIDVDTSIYTNVKGNKNKEFILAPYK